MNKKLLVAAIGGVVLAGAAQAQSNVTLYGKIDEALQIAKTPNGTLSNLAGSESGTRWGLKGSEDLGGGLSAIFQLESGFNADTGAGQGNLFNRISTVGLKGNFGTFELGRKDTPLFNVLDMADPFGSSTSASLQYSLWASGAPSLTAASINSRGYDRRFQNGFLYTTPNFGGFTAQALYSLGENNTVNGSEDSRGNVAGLSLIYANGPAYLGYAYNRAQADSSVGTGSLAGIVTGVTPHKYQALAGSYDFSVVKLYGAYYSDKQNNKSLSTPAVNALSKIDQRVYWFSVSAPVGAMSSVAATVGKVNDKTSSDQDAKQWGLGYFYNLSKRTYLYGTYGSINNKNIAAGLPLVTTSANGLTNNSGKSGAYDLGIVHKF